MASISQIVTGIYDSRWCASSRLRLPANVRKFMVLRAGFSGKRIVLTHNRSKVYGSSSRIRVN